MGKVIWTKERLEEFLFEGDEEIQQIVLEKEEVFDCPIHGKLGGVDECPRC